MRAVETEELKQLLIRNWMTHDAMWFRHCLEECGIDKTNKINRAAIRSMAAIEVRRVMKLLGIAEIRSMAALKGLIDGAWPLIKGDFMEFEYSYPAPNVMRCDVHRCFAFDGISQIGAIGQYQCGIFERIEGWFDTLKLTYTVSPTVTGCMMHTDGKCFREYTFDFTAG